MPLNQIVLDPVQRCEDLISPEEGGAEHITVALLSFSCARFVFQSRLTFSYDNT